MSHSCHAHGYSQAALLAMLMLTVPMAMQVAAMQAAVSPDGHALSPDAHALSPYVELGSHEANRSGRAARQRDHRSAARGQIPGHV